MKSSRQRIGIFLLLIILSITVYLLLFLYPSMKQDIQGNILLSGILILVFVQGAIGRRKYQRLKMARLIMDNIILRIYPAVLEMHDHGGKIITSSIKPIEVIVSCFGILLGSEIIKFNQDGIDLKAVEIGDDMITLTYGTKQETRSIRLLHQPFDDAKLPEIVESFRYETGVIPKIQKLDKNPIGQVLK